jgi:glycosyltransferase involved in cell wall biosynthesis
MGSTPEALKFLDSIFLDSILAAMNKSAAPKASVIISVYNRLDFLKLVLAGFEVQTEQDFEIIISDDGSNEAFVGELKQIMAACPLAIRHNWHEDAGFRKNKILNESIRIAGAPYLIFTDGDCIPHPTFVEEHLAQAEKGMCLAGRRVDLSERITKMLTPEKIRQGILQSAGAQAMMLTDFLRLKLFHFMNGIYTRNSLLRKYFNRKERGLLGANFSLHKSDMLAINGFDERYTHPTYGEDSDVELRLRLQGIRLKPVLNIAVMYHCHHRLLPRPQESRAIYEMALAEQTAFTPYGIQQSTEKKQ